MLCKTEATLNNTSEKMFGRMEISRNCQKNVKSAKFNLFKGTVMQTI